MTEAAFLNAVGLFLISLVRFSGFFLTVPAYSETFIPAQIKAGLSGLCALIALPHLIATQTLPQLTILGYGIMAVKELALGFTMGYIVLLLMSALRVGGQIIGMQIGFSFVQVADPGSNQQLGIVAEFFQLAGTVSFLIIGGHLVILSAFFKSFDLVGLSGITLTPSVIEEIWLYSRMLFTCGLQISMPIVAVILMGDVGLGIIARTVPKMNIFQVGFSLKIICGFVFLIIMFPLLSDFINLWIKTSLEEINLLLSRM